MSSEMFKNMNINEESINTKSIVYKLTLHKISNNFINNKPPTTLVKAIKDTFPGLFKKSVLYI
jgi:hypothetical protein